MCFKGRLDSGDIVFNPAALNIIGVHRKATGDAVKEEHHYQPNQQQTGQTGGQQDLVEYP